ncbi:MAG: sensor histidine kinase [Candidatus Aureabacteria bacterium]|nr:sensor histidine kinase [Candidatus Auribacterota bacterium]
MKKSDRKKTDKKKTCSLKKNISDVKSTRQKKGEKGLRKKDIVLKEHVKKLDCLNCLCQIVQNPNINLEEIFKNMVDLIPPALQYPDITCAIIVFKRKEFKTKNCKKSRWKLKTNIKLFGKNAGTVEVRYLKKMPDADTGPFLKEETALIKAIAKRLGRIAERKKTAEELKKKSYDLDERVKELNCFYGLSKLEEQPEITLEGIFSGMVKLIPPALQHPDITCTIIIFEGKEFKTKNCKKSRWKLKTNIKLFGKNAGTVEVRYLKKMPDTDTGPFLKEETALIKAVAKRLGRIAERKKTAEELKKHQRLLEISERNLKAFSQNILHLREEEKKKLAVDLHDELGSSMVRLNSHLTITEEEVKDRNLKKAFKSIKDTKNTLKSVIENLKKIVSGLRPPALDIIGITGTLKQYFSIIAKQEKFNWNFKADLKHKKLNDDISIVLYRVAQEALNNIIKHSDAKNVKIDLCLEANDIKFRIYDDGKGFDTLENILQKAGILKMGIRGMIERVESLGGVFSITSKSGKGTKIDIIFSNYRTYLKRITV